MQSPQPALPADGLFPPEMQSPPPMPPAASLPPPSPSPHRQSPPASPSPLPPPTGSAPLPPLPPLPHAASTGVVARAELDEFTVDDVLWWLQATAFRSRPPLAGPPAPGGARQAHRQQIREEIRTLKRRAAGELAPSAPSAAVEVRL